MNNTINRNKPPKDREFLGLVVTGSHTYWDFFWWATKEDGVNGKSQFVDRDFFQMPNIEGWIEVPEVDL